VAQRLLGSQWWRLRLARWGVCRSTHKQCCAIRNIGSRFIHVADTVNIAVAPEELTPS
jgi:hypothetical protein